MRRLCLSVNSVIIGLFLTIVGLVTIIICMRCLQSKKRSESQWNVKHNATTLKEQEGLWVIKSATTMDTNGGSMPYQGCFRSLSRQVIQALHWNKAIPIHQKAVYITTTSHYILPSKSSKYVRIYLAENAELFLYVDPDEIEGYLSLQMIILSRDSKVHFIPTTYAGQQGRVIQVHFRHNLIEPLTQASVESMWLAKACRIYGASVLKVGTGQSSSYYSSQADQKFDNMIKKVKQIKQELQTKEYQLLFESRKNTTLEDNIANLKETLRELDRSLNSTFGFGDKITTIGVSVFDILCDDVDPFQSSSSCKKEKDSPKKCNEPIISCNKAKDSPKKCIEPSSSCKKAKEEPKKCNELISSCDKVKKLPKKCS